MFETIDYISYLPVHKRLPEATESKKSSHVLRQLPNATDATPLASGNEAFR